MKTQQKQESSKAARGGQKGGKPARSIKNISMKNRPPPASVTSIKKPRRLRPLVRANMEIREQQNLCRKNVGAIPKVVVERAVRGVGGDLIESGYFDDGIDGHKSSIAGGLRFTKGALEAIRFMTEEFGTHLFCKTAYIARGHGRITIHTEDLSDALEVVRPEIYETLRNREMQLINERKEKSSTASRMASMGLDSIPPSSSSAPSRCGQRKGKKKKSD